MSKQITERVDLGIIIALQEEFSELLALCSTVSQHKTDKLTVYRFHRRDYRIVAAFVGEMGAAQAGRIAERMIDAWNPESIVSMGIAAGVHDDVRVGDVYVPVQANEYIQSTSAISNPNEPSALVFAPSGSARRTDYKFVDAVRNLEFVHPDIYKRFVGACAEDLAKLVRDTEKRQHLVDQHVIRPSVAVISEGHVATGPVVEAAEAFAEWIRSHDPKAKAIEMETARVFMSAQEYGKVTRSLAIRGISGYSDERKKSLDEISGGALRKYAMRNAVRFLWALLEAKALPPNAS